MSLFVSCEEEGQDDRAAGEMRHSPHLLPGPPSCLGGRWTVVTAARSPAQLAAALHIAGPLAALLQLVPIVQLVW